VVADVVVTDVVVADVVVDVLVGLGDPDEPLVVVDVLVELGVFAVPSDAVADTDSNSVTVTVATVVTSGRVGMGDSFANARRISKASLMSMTPLPLMSYSAVSNSSNSTIFARYFRILSASLMS
jgi:hypothetical protein